MDVRIIPRPLSGTVTPPPSKSMAHRLIIAAALAKGTSTIHNVALSQDIEATLRCMEALGGRWERPAADTLRVTGIGGGSRQFETLPRFDCGESGSTLRFLIPIALAVAGGGVFTGRGRLMERPQKPYFDLFDEKGISYTLENGVLMVRGRLTPGEFRLPGNVSSQFFTGLLYALPLLDGPSAIVSTTALESADYITMTREAMRTAGVSVTAGWAPPRFQVSPSAYQAFDGAVEADWSQAGFWYAAQGIGSSLTIQGMNEASVQGDRVILDYGEILRGEGLRGGVTVPILSPAGKNAAPPPPERPGWNTPCVGNVSLDISRCPDLAPPLAAWGALLNGSLYLKNAARLRMKESDRLATITAGLKALGAEVYEEPDRLTIVGKPSLPGGTVNSANDHRIAMMAAIAATGCTGPVTILGAECVRKSYPDFWEVYESLGGEIHVL